MSQNGQGSEPKKNTPFESPRHSLVPTPVIDLLAARKKRKEQKQQDAKAAKPNSGQVTGTPGSRIWFGFARVAQIVFVVIATLYILRTCGRI